MTLPSPVARYLDGVAFIVYGPGPGPEPLAPPTHHPHHTRSHSHKHHEPEDQPAHFWAVFRPNTTTTTTILYKEQQQQQQQQPTSLDQEEGNKSNSDEVLFFLQGTPHPWGSYPPDMDQPHDCLPPHLYYHVTIFEHNSSTANEWVLPFVHRIGNGNDHAGGLTTMYSLLRDQEDAEDLGDFIHARTRQLQCHNELASSDAIAATTENSISASLYACTEVLVSERRALDVIQQQFFSTITATATPQSSSFKEFQHHLQKTLDTIDTTSQSLPFFLVQSNLKLILPPYTAHHNIQSSE